MDVVLAITGLVIVAAISIVAVFHPAFDDSLIQRICLCGFCLGALALANQIYQDQTVSEPVLWCSILAAVWGIESGRRVKK